MVLGQLGFSIMHYAARRDVLKSPVQPQNLPERFPVFIIYPGGLKCPEI